MPEKQPEYWFQPEGAASTASLTIGKSGVVLRETRIRARCPKCGWETERSSWAYQQPQAFYFPVVDAPQGPWCPRCVGRLLAEQCGLLEDVPGEDD